MGPNLFLPPLIRSARTAGTQLLLVNDEHQSQSTLIKITVSVMVADYYFSNIDSYKLLFTTNTHLTKKNKTV